MVAEARLHLAFLANGQSGYWQDNEDPYTNGFGDEVNRRGNEPPQPDLLDRNIPGSTVHNDFGSSHSAGINALFADGSVTTITYGINPTMFRRATIFNDGQIYNP